MGININKNMPENLNGKLLETFGSSYEVIDNIMNMRYSQACYAISIEHRQMAIVRLQTIERLLE